MTGKTLMIIDDQTGTTKVVSLIAAQVGMECRTLNSSVHATEAFIEYRPDVLILDMIMPEKDGIDVLNEVLQTGVPAKIVLISGSGDAYLRLAEGVAKFHGAQHVSVIKKPFRRDQLIEILTRLSAEIDAEAGSRAPVDAMSN